MWLTRRAAAPWSTRGEREPECDRAWTSCLGVSFVLKESQLLAERSRNHTDRPMDGASVSQGRVLQCSFHPLFPSLSRCCSQLLFLSRHPSRHPTTFSLFLSLCLSLFHTRGSHPPAPSRSHFHFTWFALCLRVYFPFALRAPRSPLQMSPRGRLTFALRPLASSSPRRSALFFTAVWLEPALDHQRVVH